MSEEVETQPIEPTPKPAKPQLSLDEQFVAWLKRNNAQPILTVVAPRGGEVSIENYIPAGWTPTVRIVEAKSQ